MMRRQSLKRKGVRTMSVLIKQEIGRNGIGRLGELFREWLEENHKPADEPIMTFELVSFFEYVENALWNGR